MFWIIKKDEFYSITQTKKVRPKHAVAEWPKEIPREDFPFATITNDGQGNVDVIIDEGKRAQAQSESNAAAQLTKDYADLNIKVNQDMAIAFATQNMGSAIRQYLMFLRMAQRPELYDREKLRALRDIGSLKRGDNLDTTVKILEYANGCLAIIDQFSITAEQEVISFLDKKEAITGQW